MSADAAYQYPPPEGEPLPEPPARVARSAASRASFDSGRPLVEFDRDGVEAVLKRAIELGARPGSEIVELDPAVIMDIADQVGVPAQAVASALAEQRLGIDGKQSLIDRIVGPDVIWTQRWVDDDVESVTARTLDWLERGHGLRPRVGNDGVVTARKRSDMAGKVGRSWRSMSGGGGLGAVREISAVAISVDDPAEEGETAGSLAMSADLSDKRSGALVGGGSVAAVGTAAVASLAIVASPAVLVALPIVAGAGVLTSRLTFRRTLDRAQVNLAITADEIASGVDAPGLLDGITESLSRKVTRRRRR